MYRFQFEILAAYIEIHILFIISTLIFRDVKTGEIVFAHVNLEFCETMWYPSFNLRMKAPCILPELHLLLRASIDDQRYHKVTFDSLEALRKLLDENQGLLIFFLEANHS